MKVSSQEPYSLTVKGAAEHFGFHPKTIYAMISAGHLRRGYHYLKVSEKEDGSVLERLMEGRKKADLVIVIVNNHP